MHLYAYCKFVGQFVGQICIVKQVPLVVNTRQHRNLQMFEQCVMCATIISTLSKCGLDNMAYSSVSYSYYPKGHQYVIIFNRVGK